MKSKIIAAAIAGLSFVSVAASAESFDDYAKVTSVNQVYKDVNQRQQVCEDVEVATQGNGGSMTGTVIGGIAGGLLGNQVGGGNGRIAATAVSSVIGAMVGNSLGGNNNGGTTTRQQCRTVNNITTEKNGYMVTYEYAGNSFSSLVSRDPGRHIRVAVSVVAR